ncbi:galactokinase [Nibricoccus aquaticus]|uniref:Galactokinase n=1 Tax=Nibricoccus aquaticus TaxID=2576891 RepID=A0A290Q6M4_9BACT|nr:galactokinase [Nibricoccus aquaticus]ATC64325.1 galactokinase [Nibricoccus aquaticus]
MKEQIIAQFQKAFGRAPEFVTRAPGRIEFIGNHTDYNGGTVLGASIDRGVWVALARRTDGKRRFFSAFAGEITEAAAGVPQAQTGKASWINYPLGVLAALPVFGLKAPEGFDYVAASDLPTGAGLSSSAAIELASALAFLEATGQRPDRETVVKIGKHAENHFVGVPCGILDQGVSGFGKKDHLVFIDCRGPKFATVPLPSDAHFWIFNTHHKHALVDGMYAARHRECMEAAKAIGVSLLVEASIQQLDAAKATLSSDAYKRAKHVIEEIARVEAANTALRAGDLAGVGKLLTASHRSSQNYFENSTPELDLLVDTLTGTPEVFGARLTGGGFGGAVMALTSARFGDAQAESVAAVYEKVYGTKPEILHCQTGDGAAVS